MTAENHRSRVAAEKRERMHTRLVESALNVFAAKGADSAVIEDVIAAAGVSRGTFYNYFKTNEELLVAVFHAVGDEVFSLVESVVLARKDPAERLACALRMVLYTAKKYGHLARFLSKVGLASVMNGSLAMEYMPRDLVAGIEAGRFAVPNPQIGIDLIVGTSQAAIVTLSSNPMVPETYPDDVVHHILLGLGASKALARRLSSTPIEVPEMSEVSLLVRTGRPFAADGSK